MESMASSPFVKSAGSGFDDLLLGCKEQAEVGWWDGVLHASCSIALIYLAAYIDICS